MFAVITSLSLLIGTAGFVNSTAGSGNGADGGTALAASALELSPIARRSSASADFCPDAQAGDVCRMTWPQAISFCKSQNGRLPTAREYATLLVRQGVRILETNEVQGAPPPGYYLVDCRNPDGTLDAFFMNHEGYSRPPGRLENHLLWTASVPPQHPQFAHVFYDEWGGGGGEPADHRLDRRNAVQCLH